MIYILIYMFFPVMLIILGIMTGRIQTRRVMAMFCFFIGPIVAGLTRNVLAIEFFWVFSFIFFKNWQVQSRGEGASAGMNL